MKSAQVIPLRQPDDDLRREAEAAVRIAAGVRERKRGAETELVERYSRGLGYLLRQRCGDPERARDLLQETFCIAIEKLRSTDIENPERLAGYLRGIAVRVALNAGRKRSREPYPIDSEDIAAIPDQQPHPYRQIDAEQTGRAVHRLLAGMSVGRDRELLIRYYVYDEDKETICAELGLESLHFNRVLYRAKARFRKLLESSAEAAELLPPEPSS